MLVLWTVIIFLGLSVNCGDSWSPKKPYDGTPRYKDLGKNTETNVFYIEIREAPSIGITTYPYRDDGAANEYASTMGKQIELKCFYEGKDESTDLYWQDNNGFTSGIYHQMRGCNSTIKLKVTPDAEDMKSPPRLSCTANSTRERKEITITLKMTQSAKSDKNANVRYVNREEPLKNNATCYAIVYPQTGNAPSSSQPNGMLIRNFTEQDNGTFVYCYRYEIMANMSDGIIFARTKSKLIYYLNETNTQMDFSGNEGKKDKPPPTQTVAIVSGIVGSIILLFILIIVCYKSKLQRLPPNETADQVIYAEIYPTRPQIDFLRRDEQPYARIVGILMPKQPVDTQEENHYCTVR